MKIEKGSVPSLLIQIVAFIVAAIIIWPLMDMFICAIFTHSDFVYSVQAHIIEPIIFGIIAGIVFWTIDKISMKKKQK